jgi:hypothetical protein
MSLFKNNFVVGLTAGLAATVIAPVLMPALKRGSRPVAKNLIRGGILLYQKGREAVATSGEMMEDMLAEIQSEDVEKRRVMEQASDGKTERAAEEKPAGPVGIVKKQPESRQKEEQGAPAAEAAD